MSLTEASVSGRDRNTVSNTNTGNRVLGKALQRPYFPLCIAEHPSRSASGCECCAHTSVPTAQRPLDLRYASRVFVTNSGLVQASLGYSTCVSLPVCVDAGKESHFVSCLSFLDASRRV